MAKSINQVVLMGNLTSDPETIEGAEIAKFSLALNRSYKDAHDAWQEATDFIDCVAFGQLAGQVLESISKGSRVLVQGRLQKSTWEQEGVKRSKVEVLARDITFMSTNNAGTNNGVDRDGS